MNSLAPLFETPFWDMGLLVAGTDEVGRGPLAGPVVAAAVLWPPGADLEGLDDSKRLTEARRNRLYPEIVKRALAIGVGAAGPRIIERINILEASRRAMRRALAALPTTPEVVLSDAMELPGQPSYVVALIHGDRRAPSIAAASVVAKVLRDRYMTELARQYPQYGFERHKGYATPEHLAALRQFGPSPAHRQTFIDHLIEP